ncbi:MAG: hypothetical protein JWM59_2190 [Verrucomicrobiales bacterium]|nr:hypothetical protein [Verrucomicrobiales bacterium]
MKHSPFHPGSRFLQKLSPALLALLISTPAALRAAAIAGLDGVSNSSTLSGQGITPLGGGGLLGWTNVTGEARFFEAGGDGSIIHNSAPYDNYSVRYSPSTPEPFLPNTQYSLTFNMGYVAGNVGGLSQYSFSLGSLAGGTYTALESVSGTAAYAGNMHSAAENVVPVTLVFTTGDTAPTGDLALEWAQTFSTAAADSSDFFGFNKVTLDASPVPEPAASLFAAAGLALVAGRRKRAATGSR